MELPIHIAFDALSGVDGSARFSFASTAAVASVSGPIAARIATEHPVRATIDLHARPLSSVPGTTEKHTSVALKGILERTCILAQHPRTLIQVVVQAFSPLASSRSGVAAEVADPDVLLAAEINACSLALLNAGSIPMRGVVCAVAVALPSSANQPRLVTDSGHAKHAGCFAFLFGVDQTHTSAGVSGASSPIPPSKMIWTNYHASPGNTFSVTALAEAEKVALEGASAVWMKMKESLGASSFTGDGLS